MSEVNPNGVTVETANAEGATKEQDETEANATRETAEQVNARLLSESKSWKARALKAEREKQDQLKKAAEEQGNYKTLYETSQNELVKIKSELVKNSVSSAIESISSKYGCIDPKALMKLGNKDLIQVDESTFEVFGAETFVEDAKKSMPYLFRQGSQAQINPVSPSGVVTKKQLTATDIAKLPMNERIKILSKMQK
jgi:hypothetical protein